MTLLFHRPVRFRRRTDRCLVLDVEHNATRTVPLLLRFHVNPRTDPFHDPSAGRITTALYPHLRVRLCLDLTFLEQARSHFPRRIGVGHTANGGPVVRIADIISISGFADRPPKGFKLRVHALRMTDTPEPGAVLAPDRPLVDRFGQLKSRSWPGKVRRIQREEAPSRIGATSTIPLTGIRPASNRWSVEKTGSRFWLVAPTGERVFSTGVCCVRPVSEGPVTGMERLHEWLPKRSAGTVSFYSENLKRRYGDAWRSAWARLTNDRLAAWGFNTIANWSDPDAWQEQRLWYTMNASWWDEPKTASGWGLYQGFPDVFSPAFARRCDDAARHGCRPDDPLLMGYFVLNEPGWQRTDLHMAQLALRSDRAPHTKRALVAWLRKKYGSGSARPRPGDLDRLRDLMVDRYFATVCGALRKHDPSHLLLGIRFYGTPPSFLLKAMRHMDVVSMNNYEAEPNRKLIEALHRATGKPVMLGEFHHGSVDRGMTHTGLVGVVNQRERGIGYARYMERAAAIPCCVGAHFFQWVDQPVLGRFDGENYNIGLVDVTDRPYPELVAAASAANRKAALIHAGRARPATRRPRPLPTGILW